MPESTNALPVPRILIVDDDRVSRELLAEVLKKAGYLPTIAGSAEDALALNSATPFPLVLSDIRMLEMSGLDLLRGIKSGSPHSVVVLMTGFGSVDGALEAIREGAFDYLSKPFEMGELKQVLARAGRHYESSRNSERPSHSVAAPVATQGMLGRTPKIVEVYKLMARAALSTSSVLITGEPGTGKALIAQTIHKNSTKCEAPLLTLSQEDLDSPDLEARLNAAAGGVIVCEEICGLTTARQARLVRALESAENRALDLRWMTLSRKTYGELTESEDLRPDLLYLLSVVAIEIPPLRDRRDDLPEMISSYIAKYNERNAKAVSHVSPEAMHLLMAYHWPGNVRELERVIERAVALANTSVLDTEDFRETLFGNETTGTRPELVDGTRSLEEMEKRHIVGVLQQLAFNKSKAAEALGIDRATLYRKAKLYGINLQSEKRPSAD